MSEIYIAHHGVKGMKWGIRRYQRKDGSRTSLGEKHQLKLNRSYDDGTQAPKKKITSAKADIKKSKTASEGNDNNRETEKKGLTDKQKKAIKVGAAVVGTALAAYGTYKVAQYMQDKRSMAAMQKAKDYVNSNTYKKIYDATFIDGSKELTYVNKAGDKIVMRGARDQVGKAIGQQNAKAIATGRQMYKDATSTKLDKGLAKIVNTGDAISDTAKRTATSVGNTTKRAATKTKNAVLDVVNPIYEYRPNSSTSTTRTTDAGINITKTLTKYDKILKKRNGGEVKKLVKQGKELVDETTSYWTSFERS